MLNRRELLSALGVGASIALLSPTRIRADEKPERKAVRIALNTGTLMGYKLDVEKEIDLAAEAGYDGIELWMSGIQRFTEKGGKLPDLKKQLDDKGLSLVSAIGFPNWLVDDEKRRNDGLKQITAEMEVLALLGCKNIAAPAAGVSEPIKDIEEAGKRYRTILEIGEKTGVRPLLEIWGSSPALSKVSTACAIALASGRSDASLLLDAYHIYKGGNSFESLVLLNGASMPVFHINDYPADPPREKIGDGDRVLPGDGICPLKDIIKTLRETGFSGFLSLELFNRQYWESLDPLSLAKKGREKTATILGE